MINNLEIWQDAPGYFGGYQISSFGRIKANKKIDFSGHLRNEKFLNGTKTKGGYIAVLLSKNGKRKVEFIHRLVALAFIPNIENRPCINHKDNNPSNNRIENLEWCTHKENSAHRDMQGRNWDIRGCKNPMFNKRKEKCPNYGEKSHRARIVLDINNGIFYRCVREAAEYKNINYNTLKARLFEKKEYFGLKYV